MYHFILRYCLPLLKLEFYAFLLSVKGVPLLSHRRRNFSLMLFTCSLASRSSDFMIPEIAMFTWLSLSHSVISLISL